MNSMSERNLLFIVEGEADEPTFIRRLFRVCYAQQSYRTYTYKTNLHTLAKRLEDDYPDFDGDETDICLILRSYESSDTKRAILSEKYTDVFLIFDFEPQHDPPHFETIRRMLNYFQDSTSQGKLFINYPMMQSYKHFSALPDPLFYDTKATITDWGHYKQIVGSVSAYTDTTHYTYPIFVSLTAHHMKKANYILTGLYSLPSLDEYCSWNLTDIFEKQLVYKNRDSFVYVLNTCIFVLADYQPTSFFRQLRDRGNQFFID